MTYTTRQVAKKIGVRPRTLEEWLLQGLKPPRKRFVDGVFVRLWEEHDLDRARIFSVNQPTRPGHRGDPGKAVTRLYTTAEVANHLKVNKMTVMRWVSSGSVKKPKFFTVSAIGTTWLWAKEELARLSTIRNMLFGRRRRHSKGRADMIEPHIKRASNTRSKPKLGPQVKIDDPVEEASKESFPASDSPAWNAGQDPPVPGEEK